MEKYIDLIWVNYPMVVLLSLFASFIFGTTYNMWNKDSGIVDKITMSVVVTVVFPIGIGLIIIYYYDMYQKRKKS